MIAVDTSIWIAALRDSQSRESRILQPLLDDDEVLLPIPVKIELLSGTSRRQRDDLMRGLEGLPVAYPTDETWRTLVAWTDRTSSAGATFGVGDLLIAAIASEHGALMWSLDSAFARMSRLRLVSPYAPDAG
jgi:predicted nucleic acid-binding protein